MSDRVKTPVNVLFLCTGNSARSLICEALLRDMNEGVGVGEGRFSAFSAGSNPTGTPHPNALAELERRGVSTAGLRSKSWDEFTGPDADAADIIITVCDSANNETCPAFTGLGVRAHWGIPDPAAVEDANDRKKAFSDTFEICRIRIDRLVRLPTASLEERQAIQAIAMKGDAELHPQDYPEDHAIGRRAKPRD